jgi:hypothetical protein
MGAFDAADINVNKTENTEGMYFTH